MDDETPRDITPSYPATAPEQLSLGEVRRIDRLLGRPARNVELALAERYRRDGDLSLIVAQQSIELHDLHGTVGWWQRWGLKLGLFGLSVIGGSAIYVASAIWGASERNTAIEFRLRACEELKIRVDALYQPSRFPQASRAAPADTEPRRDPIQ